MSTKMEQLLDLLVNEEMDKAHELFHEIVVEKSRSIYENLIAEEAEEEQGEMEESTEDEDNAVEEELEEETTFEIGGDAADDMVGDIGGDDMGADAEFGDEGDDEMGGDEFGGQGTEEERIEDLEDALAELKAEFEALMADEKNEPEHSDGEDDPDFGGDDEEGDDEEGEEDGEEDEMMGMENVQVREYVEKVGNDWEKSGSMKTPGPVGGGKGDLAGQTSVSDTKSPVSSGKGKPTTGATAHNILKGGTGVGEMSGTSPNADKGSRGLVGSTKGEYTKGVTKNKTSSSKTAMPDGAALSKVSGGKASGEGQGWGSGKGDLAGQTGAVDTKSPLSGAPGRNA
jgi:hypothetical protein